MQSQQNHQVRIFWVIHFFKKRIYFETMDMPYGVWVLYILRILIGVWSVEEVHQPDSAAQSPIAAQP